MKPGPKKKISEEEQQRRIKLRAKARALAVTELVNRHQEEFLWLQDHYRDKLGLPETRGYYKKSNKWPFPQEE